MNKLGDYLERCIKTNKELLYGLEDVRGVNNQKALMITKADIADRDLTKFLIIEPNSFVFNRRTSRHGDKFCIAYNDTDKTLICTEDYVVFKVKTEARETILDEWLYMFFRRSETDRCIMYHSWGSSTEFFNWEEICSLEIEIPSLHVQQKYVNIYKAMVSNQLIYQSGLEDMKLICDGYIEELRRSLFSEKIGPYIRSVENRNTDLAIKLAQGINNEKQFISPKQVAKAAINAKIVRKGQFAFNRATTRNGERLSIALRDEEDCVVSSAYQVFEVKDKDKLLPEYLMLWYKRAEFDRYARFVSQGSAHEFFEFEDMCEVKIPIPDINKQRAIASIYSAYNLRKSINERMKEKIVELCPVLIKGSLIEGEA